jgi:hypothetical protein
VGELNAFAEGAEDKPNPTLKHAEGTMPNQVLIFVKKKVKNWKKD